VFAILECARRKEDDGRKSGYIIFCWRVVLIGLKRNYSNVYLYLSVKPFTYSGSGYKESLFVVIVKRFCSPFELFHGGVFGA